MAYDKYKKIKDRPSYKTASSGMTMADNYVDDEKKISPQTDLEKDAFLSSVASASIYAENEMKTINPEGYQRLVSGINCAGDDFVKLCTAADQLYHQDHDEHLNPGQTANQGFHIISSFQGHPAPELVHRAGLELGRRLCLNDFYGKVCTHLNTDNYHNHILIGAYAIDGSHKFKDEWHLYRKIREISNEISMEYGLDIITSENTERSSWAELFQSARLSEVQSAARELKQAINDARKEADTFEGFLQKMKEKGWEYRRSKGTVHYQKEGISLSDTRLGSRYTKRGIEEMYARNRARQAQILQSSAEWQNRSCELSAQPPKIHPVYVPRYSKTGLRLPQILRLLLLVRTMIQVIGDTWFDWNAARRFPESIASAPAFQKLKWIDEAVNICSTYGISTKSQLDDRIVHVGMNAKAKDYQAAKLYGAADLMSKYVQDLQRYRDLQSVMKALNINESCFSLPSFTQEEIARNRAALDPMDVRLKRRLYHALGASEYRLRPGSFSMLSRTDAESILSFLKGETEERPAALFLTGYQASCELTEDVSGCRPSDSQKDSSDSFCGHKVKPVRLSDYPEEIQRLIQAYRNTLDITCRFGLHTEAAVDAFIDHYNDLLSRADSLSSESRTLSREYRDLKRLQRLLGKVDSPVFVYGIRYDGTAQELKTSLDSLGDDRYDQLMVLQDEIEAKISSLKSLKPQPADLDSPLYLPADTETRGLLRKLKKEWPEYFSDIAGKEINVELVTDYEALDVLEEFQKMNILKREIDRLRNNNIRSTKQPIT